MRTFWFFEKEENLSQPTPNPLRDVVSIKRFILTGLQTRDTLWYLNNRSPRQNSLLDQECVGQVE